MTDQITVPPLQGLAAYLRCEAGGVFVGSPNHETLMQWAREVDALTAAASVSHPKTEAAPATEGGAITSESAANAVGEPKGLFVDLIASHGPEFVAEMAAIDAEPQAQGEAAKKYAENLCISMARKFYPEVTQFEPLDDLFGLLTQIDNMTTGLARPQATEPAEKEDPLQGAVDWLLQADGEFFAVATVQRTLRIGYNRAKRLADIARERAAAPEAKQ